MVGRTRQDRHLTRVGQTAGRLWRTARRLAVAICEPRSTPPDRPQPHPPAISLVSEEGLDRPFPPPALKAGAHSQTVARRVGIRSNDSDSDAGDEPVAGIDGEVAASG